MAVSTAREPVHIIYYLPTREPVLNDLSTSARVPVQLFSVHQHGFPYTSGQVIQHGFPCATAKHCSTGTARRGLTNSLNYGRVMIREFDLSPIFFDHILAYVQMCSCCVAFAQSVMVALCDYRG